ncbi:hypothetical protein Asi02nite_20930 [Asanoa siamensis]|uniref:Uncharacterized protein n=1 Tax=Asanoa siamensis TaxID=926357 RepID=A0ABQ4CMR0_9ACTN|nr:hypothetical protein Asi02nite_20930 [Asanoa siamensis]
MQHDAVLGLFDVVVEVDAGGDEAVHLRGAGDPHLDDARLLAGKTLEDDGSWGFVGR